jgi:putative transcriptional regulator
MTMTMPPTHHPDESALLDYAAGACSEAASVMIASHLALCPLCRADVARLEELGGILLDDIAPTPLESANLGDLLARLDALDETPEPAPIKPVLSESALLLPQPLRDYVGDPDALPWRKLGGLEEAELAHGSTGEHLRLLRVKGGGALPRHTHHGNEMIMVLTGAFTDVTGHYRRGDFAMHDDSIDHRPVADAGADCVCLLFTDAPLRFTGPLGWLLNRFIKF